MTSTNGRFCALVACLVGLSAFAYQDNAIKQGGEMEKLYPRLELAKHVAISDETIRYRVTLPREANVVVQSMSFHVERIGIFHRAVGGLVHLDSPLTSHASLSRAFDGLPSSVTASHGLDTNFKNDSRHGITETFRPIKSGYYLITVECLLRKREGSLRSNTVFLEVQPRRDQKGRAVIDERSCSGDDLEDQETLERLFDYQQEDWDQ